MIIFIVIFILFFNLIDFLVYRYDRILIKTALIKNQSYLGKFFKSSWTKNLYLYISFKFLHNSENMRSKNGCEEIKDCV